MPISYLEVHPFPANEEALLAHCRIPVSYLMGFMG